MRIKDKSISFAEAINIALKTSMKKDKNLICYGLGVTDPKNIFGTTKDLEKIFGKRRVFDVPCSENALTGVSIGAAISGTKSIVTHQRLDFFLLALDQLVNSAAKWHFMFGGQVEIPITIRLIIGKGWGQGPTHSQNLQSWFAHIPGLKVVMPTTPQDAKDLLIKSILDPNPVIFLETRWLHSQIGKVSNKVLQSNIIGKCKIMKRGKDVTIVAMSYLVPEALRAASYLKRKLNIECEIIDLRTIKPIDYKTIYNSLKKTKNLLVVDTGHKICSVASEIISEIIISKKIKLHTSPQILALPDIPEPTSYSLTKNYHVNYRNIFLKILEMKKIKKSKIYFKNLFKKDKQHHDQPHKKFFGPF